MTCECLHTGSNFHGPSALRYMGKRKSLRKGSRIAEMRPSGRGSSVELGTGGKEGQPVGQTPKRRLG